MTLLRGAAVKWAESILGAWLGWMPSASTMALWCSVRANPAFSTNPWTNASGRRFCSRCKKKGKMKKLKDSGPVRPALPPSMMGVSWRHGEPPTTRTRQSRGMNLARWQVKAASSRRRFHTSAVMKWYGQHRPSEATRSQWVCTADASLAESSMKKAAEMQSSKPALRSILRSPMYAVPMPSNRETKTISRMLPQRGRTLRSGH